MRTTIRVDDELYRRVRARAAASGRSIGEVIEDAIRMAVDRDTDPTTQVSPLPVYGGAGVLPGVDLADNTALREAMDADVSADALR